LRCLRCLLALPSCCPLTRLDTSLYNHLSFPPCLLLLGAPLHALLAGVVIKRALITSQGYIDDW